MIIDVFIILFLISSLFRGKEVGFVRQLFSTIGFFGGLLLGALLVPHIIGHAHTAVSRSLVTLITTLGCAFVLLVIGEYIGIVLKTKVSLKRIKPLDNVLRLGAGDLHVLSAYGSVLPSPYHCRIPAYRRPVNSSAIVGLLNRSLPPATTIIADLSHLIDPNGFPQVFNGVEPAPTKT